MRHVLLPDLGSSESTPDIELLLRPLFLLRFLLELANPIVRLATLCSHLVHCRPSQALLVRALRVSFDLFQRSVAGDGRNLVRAATGLREPTRSSLPQAMCGTVGRQSSCITLLSEPMAKSARRITPAKLSRQERKMVGGCPVDDLGEFRVDRNPQFGSSFLLPDV